MNETEFYNTLCKAAEGFALFTFKTDESTSSVGAIHGTYKKVIGCYWEDVLIARLEIDVCTFKTTLEVRKGSLMAPLEETSEFMFKHWIWRLIRKTLKRLKFRNRLAEQIRRFADKNGVKQLGIWEWIRFLYIMNASTIGESGKKDAKEFINLFISNLGYDGKLLLKDLEEKETNNGNASGNGSEL